VAGVNQRQILIVDDDPSIRTLLRLVAERRGYSVDMAADGVDALRLLAEFQYDLAIIDLMMPRVNGYELVDAMRRFEQRPAVVIATAMTDSLIGLVDADVVHSIIRKPFDIEIVGSLMTAIVEKRKAASQPETKIAAAEHLPDLSKSIEPPAC
jgi:DNA-binding response OmpR family regulator